MSQQPSLYSESWYRVRHQHISLRPNVKIHKQSFRGQIWYVVEDPFNNRFFRFRPEAYTFIARLTQHKTVEEVWQQCLEEDPENAPGQPEVIRMLAQLYQSSLLQSDLSPDATRLFERQRRQKQRELKAKLLSILFIRIPLFDPNKLLDRLLPFARPFLTRFGFFIWVVTLLFGLKTVIDNAGALLDQTEGILAPGRLAFLYLSFILVKILHEAGHGLLTKKFGGEVHTAGIMLMVFNPIPYVDATSAWAFRERWKRVLVGSGGMIVELFLASIAAFVWAATDAGVWNALAYNVMFVASVSTLLLNINPLMRFDGYYILSDLTETPNLNQRSNKHVLYLLERYVLGNKDAETLAESKKEGFWLSLFATAGWIYRIFIFAVILWFVADRFFGLGFIAAMIGIVTFFIVPVVRLIKFLITEPRIEEIRLRAQLITASITAAIVLFLGFVPMPYAFRSHGVFQSNPHREIYSASPGILNLNIRPSLEKISTGDSLFEMSNPELPIQLQASQAERQEIEALLQVAFNDPKVRLPAERQLEAVEKKIDRLQSYQQNLNYPAPLEGQWVVPAKEDLRGAYLQRGSPIGLILTPGQYTFLAVVSQRNAVHLFNEEIRGANLKVPGQTEHKLNLQNLLFIPAEQQVLPHPSLGWAGGGPVEVATDDPRGIRTVEPFFLVQADINLDSANSVVLGHNLRGVIRFRLPPTPYFWQGYQYLRRLLQKRFQI